MPHNITLEPILQKDSQHRAIQKEIDAYFYEVVFKPLFDLLGEFNVKTKKNAIESALTTALQNGDVYYTNGTFTGSFNAAISRELRGMGATFDKVNKVFHLPESRLPLSLRQTIGQSLELNRQLNKEMLETLSQMEMNIGKADTGINLKFSLDGVFVDLRKQYERTLKQHGLPVPPDLSESVKESITVEYTKNLDKYIKNFTEEMIPELRGRIQENTFDGGRPDKMAKIIQAQYGVSKRKSEFLAEQETSLLLSKYRESRYKDLGSRRYIWSTSNDGDRVRHDHRLLNNQVFYWDSPPITNRATGARNNPGEDFRCRCVARPILPIQED